MSIRRLLATPRPDILALAAILGLLSLPACSTPQEALAPAAAPQTKATAGPPAATARIVLVEWRIKKGREQEFLDYWSTRATIADRSGLIGEFLSRVEDPEKFPWMQWRLDPSWTTFVNVGFWRTSSDFQQQIGRFIDLSRPRWTSRHRVGAA